MITKCICLAACTLMALGALAQTKNADTLPGSPANKNTRTDTLAKVRTGLPVVTDTIKRSSATTGKTNDTLAKKVAPVAKSKAGTNKKYDTRWYISPLMKFQVQEFGMLEKQRKNYLSDAQNLSITDRSNMSFAASVYKNFTNHLSMSADAGFSMGHVTNSDSLISGTKSKTYNLVNATLFYHLLGGQYKLQPFISAGISNLTNEASYTSAPIGAGVKFTSKHVMIETHAAYGYSVSKNIANTLMYSLGVYIPMRSRKAKQREKDAAEEADRKKDSAMGNITNITNNFYPCDPDSIRKSVESAMRKDIEDAIRKSVIDSMSKVASDKEANRKASRKARVGDGDDTEDIVLEADDPMNLPAAVKEVVYFYYDQYALTSLAFSTVDQVIQKMKGADKLYVHLKGYTDLSGSEHYNAPLSRKRAQMVFDYMNSRGISSERMIISSYGKNNPVVNSTDPNSAWKNRRCEIVLYEKE